MLPETGLQISHFFLSAGEAGQVSCQVGGAGLTISQARELSLQDIAGLLILETAGIPSPTSQLLEQTVGADTGWREGAEKMALGDLLSLWHSATDVVMRTVPVGASVPLNCRCQERMWSLALDPGPCSAQSTKHSVPQGGLTWGSGETTWLGPGRAPSSFLGPRASLL